MRDMETKRSAPRRKNQSAPPGRGLAIATAVISGIVCWFLLESGRAQQPPDGNTLAEVDEHDIAGALTTTGLPNAARARFQAGKDGACRRPLAWVSLASAPGEPPSRVRLISGAYYSPIFEVSATPIRVAIPFPAPYETGHGTLSAIDVGGSATISLLPGWRVSAQEGKSTRAVTWRPVKNCGPGNG